MDKVIAERMESELQGSVLGGWTIGKKLGAGKSALVLKATRGSEHGAVKVFDPEIVKRFGKDAQGARGDREKRLVGNNHPNLIKILGAGYDEERDLFFTVMEEFGGKNLAEVLHDIPAGREHALFVQLVEGAKFLEDLGLAHRDIKPENIGISDDFQRAILFDFGVLAPVEGLENITDLGGQKVFIGTLQYSPPEMLFRQEEHTVEGWRAVTFYQLGAVLHDLLTRRPLFADHLFPYAKLVDAVKSVLVRNIDAPGSPPELKLLAQDCLIKDPTMRLRHVTWERMLKPLPAKNNPAAIRERLQARRLSAAAVVSTPIGINVRDAQRVLGSVVDAALRAASDDASAPPRVVDKEDGPTGVRFRVLYDASTRHAVNAPFAVYVECAITDLASKVICVRAGAAIADASLPKQAEPSWLTPIFEGVEDQDVLRERINTLVLIAYDRAAEACATSSVTSAPVDLKPAEGGL